MAFDKYVKLPGSERKPMRGAKKSGVANPKESMQVTMVLRERPSRKNQPSAAELVASGTSAVAPLWAGLVALFNQMISTPVGYLNPKLYQSVALAAGTFNDITSGNNGDYKAAPGWDACNGWGSPNGTAILKSLSSAGVSVS